ncbi:MAG: DmsC/YnfH family molybdoenzyme membrane anchor subunit, partial [Cocleimonas sp.]
MHPAFSVIFLTTLIGTGQGLFLALFTGQVFSQFKLMPEQQDTSFYVLGSIIALIFLSVGLFASFFHLGRPERAWRTATKWKTSWLSREVIALPIAMATIFAYGAAHYFGLTEPLFTMPGGTSIDTTLIAGLVATVATYALFICTGMIYACIKFLQEWHSPLTVINFTLLGTASGFLVATEISAYMGTELTRFYAGWAIFFLVVAFIFRIAALIRNRRIKPKSDLRSAIGVNHKKIRQISQGSMGGSFNTREYFHGKKESFVKSIKVIFLVLAFFIPLVILLVSLGKDGALPYIILSVAVIIQHLGLLAERWYFFA